MEGYSVEQKRALTELAEVIAENNRREAEAVQGYTAQLGAIARAKEALAGDPEAVAALDALEAATEEKIADELNHSVSLTTEYTQLTGIEPKED